MFLCFFLYYTLSSLISFSLITTLFYYFRRELLAASVSFEKTLLTVFKEKDEESNGSISLNDFTRILVNLGSTLNFEEISIIAERYKATENHGKGRNSVSDFNGFYNNDTEGTKRNFSSSGKTHTHIQECT